eukprot:CAMPEP_0196668454 /NCGR_PEP_ID=MMETSP1086-20130531/65631_1 /TAXON_ID=77921 /ORGANISM="Cyanoptyche  gloeocystis , Strain SAG4.97" /LENGTH=122 /DNA_ID=CAMNT_0042005863 /DNA_START=77 /DNA_END=445 /DNA_ORIENTATION=+
MWELRVMRYGTSAGRGDREGSAKPWKIADPPTAKEFPGPPTANTAGVLGRSQSPRGMGPETRAARAEPGSDGSVPTRAAWHSGEGSAQLRHTAGPPAAKSTGVVGRSQSPRGMGTKKRAAGA